MTSIIEITPNVEYKFSYQSKGISKEKTLKVNNFIIFRSYLQNQSYEELFGIVKSIKYNTALMGTITGKKEINITVEILAIVNSNKQIITNLKIYGGVIWIEQSKLDSFIQYLNIANYNLIESCNSIKQQLRDDLHKQIKINNLLHNKNKSNHHKSDFTRYILELNAYIEIIKLEKLKGGSIKKSIIKKPPTKKPPTKKPPTKKPPIKKPPTKKPPTKKILNKKNSNKKIPTKKPPTKK